MKFYMSSAYGMRMLVHVILPSLLGLHLCKKCTVLKSYVGKCTALLRTSSSETVKLSLTLTMCSEYFTMIAVSSIKSKDWEILHNFFLQAD